jgi:3-oxoacyl-[acyl-carrier-protein] synthase II
MAGRIARLEIPEGFPARFRRLPRAYQFALLAADQALRQAGLVPESESESVGLFFCTDHGAEEQTSQFLDDLFLKSPRLVRPLLFQNTTFAAGAGELSLHYRIKGPSYTLTSGFHSVIMALALASIAVSAGRVRYALVVACDELTRLQYQVLANLGVLAQSPAARPYDARRDGIIPSEGAAALVVEPVDSARARGAPVLGLVAGAGSSHDHRPRREADPSGGGLQRAMRRATDQAGLGLSQVEAILSSASGSRLLDRAEMRALRALGAECLPPVTALKSLLGEAHAASPGLHIVAALRILSEGLLPPTVGWDQEAPEGLRPVVRPMTIPAQRLLINAYSPGGGAASLVLTRGPTD